MLKNLTNASLVLSVALLSLSSCSRSEFTKHSEQVRSVEIKTISEEMAVVRDYVPLNAVIAHRGSTFWVPEETESAYRWAREMGVDYLEADLQCSKDGVILALHDDNLCRTTNIEEVFGESVPRTRAQYYVETGMTQEEAEAQYAADRAAFMPYYANQYMYEELLMLDAGTWFNIDNQELAREGFTSEFQYISALEDLIMYAKGYKLERDNDGERVYTTSIVAEGQKAYDFSYVLDEQDTGHRPGIYLEFKEPWLNPATFEQDIYDELDRLDFNIITKPEPASNPFYIDGKINVGNTNGKVILQTFSFESLRRTAENFKGQVPMCFLLWPWEDETSVADYANLVNIAVEHLAHIAGPCIAGAPNNYPEFNAPWQDYLIEKAGLLNHPYSFDSSEQMNKYWGVYNNGITTEEVYNPPYMDAAFTNRAELTNQFYLDQGVRPYPAPQEVPEPTVVLERLGYTK